MQTEIHEGPVEDVLPEWAELYALDDRATPFQSPAWARAWWRHWGGGARPWTVLVNDGHRLVGLAPLRRQRIPGARVLRAGAEPADYWEVIARPELRREVEDAVAQAIVANRRRWDVAALTRLAPSSSLSDALERAGVQPARTSATACPAIPLPASLDAYYAVVPRQRRSNLRRHLRRLDEGEVQIRLPAVSELPAALARWDALRKQQWELRAQRLARHHRGPRLAEFLVDVTADLMPQGRAVVSEVLEDGEVVGSFVNFCDPRCYYNYLGGYTPSRAHLGIGKIVIMDAIRTSIEARRAWYDFGRGTEDYKYWYGAEDRESHSALICSGRIRTALAVRVVALAERLPL